ncbi:MAG: hypothetical protein ACLUHD_08600, partial [Eggerthella lenta]
FSAMCSKIELLAVLLDSQATWAKRDLRFLSLTACQGSSACFWSRRMRAITAKNSILLHIGVKVFAQGMRCGSSRGHLRPPAL